ncbi:hypothetical protein BH10BAC2_BH10BAC2_02670 [soil metagenome]
MKVSALPTQSEQLKVLQEQLVEYAMARNTSPAMIADYETKLIPKNVLANKLHQLVAQLSKEEND